MEDQNQDASQDTELAEDVVESLGMPKESGDDIDQSHDSIGQQNANDPLYVQKRLKQQKRSHDREIREMQARMQEMQSQLSNPQHSQSFDANPYAQQGNQGIDETISKAVSYALNQREEEERKAKAAQAAQSISKHYGELQKHLDSLGDKYDDFDDVVRSDTAPFTATMRDAALMLPKKGAGSAGEVLYKLGKNPEELHRISKLYPHEQASELVALSHALISGGESKGNHSNRPLGQVKANPVVNSAGITEKTPVSTIRDRMKKGTFK